LPENTIFGIIRSLKVFEGLKPEIHRKQFFGKNEFFDKSVDLSITSSNFS